MLFELGVGYNTPAIIKVPFERFTAARPNATLVRINKEYPEIRPENESKTIAFGQDIGKIIEALIV
jgi:hypothetical protein